MVFKLRVKTKQPMILFALYVGCLKIPKALYNQ